MERARIDGAGEFRILWRIVLPLSKAVIAVVGLFYAVALLERVLQRPALHRRHRQVADPAGAADLRRHQTTIGGDQVSVTEALPPQLAIQMAVVVVAIVPILLVYPFLQRHFTKGVMIGAVKG